MSDKFYVVSYGDYAFQINFQINTTTNGLLIIGKEFNGELDPFQLVHYNFSKYMLNLLNCSTNKYPGVYECTGGKKVNAGCEEFEIFYRRDFIPLRKLSNIEILEGLKVLEGTKEYEKLKKKIM